MKNFFASITTELTQGSSIHPSLLQGNLEFVTETPGQWEVHELLQLPIVRFTQGDLVTGQWNRNHQFGAAAFFVSENGQIFNAKVAHPRADLPQGFGQSLAPDGKVRRYEAVKDGGNRVFYPHLSDEVRAIISSQQGVELPSCAEQPQIWPWILARPEIAVGLTEGAKKALALCSQGFLCLSLYGVANWSVPGSQPRQLMPELATLAQGQRLVPVWYDQDDPKVKLRAFLNVKAEGHKLVAALKAAGATGTSALMHWPTELGKGIDDAIGQLRSRNVNICEWLAERLEKSAQEATYDRAKGLRQLNPERPIENSTQGGYLSDQQQIELQPERIHAIIANTGSGKTSALRPMAQRWIAAGGFVVLLTPTNKLGEQNALPPERGGFGLPHRHNHYHLNLLALEAEAKGGVITCPDSLPKILPYLPTDRPILAILDECDQIANHLTEGATLKGKYAATLRAIEKLLLRARSVILAEAQIPENTLRFFEELAQKPSRIFRHQATGHRRKVTVFEGQASGFEHRLMEHLGKGKKLLIAVDSQREGEKLEQLINKELPKLRGMRVDRLTAYRQDVQALTSDPNAFLAKAQLDYLIISPAIKSGWDLTGQGYSFDLVAGIFRVLALGDQIQMPARYRPHCPWEIFAPQTIQTSADESRGSIRALVQEAATETAQTAAFYGFAYDPLNRPPLEELVHRHRATAVTRAGLEKRIAHYALVERLKEDGHQVTSAYMANHRPTKRLMAAANRQIETQWAETIAGIPLGLEDGPQEAKRLSNLEAPTPAQRAKAEKIRLAQRFPGLDFDRLELCYHATAHYRALSKQGELQAMAENISATRDRQREATAAVFADEVVAAHHLPKQLQQAWLIDAVEILPMLEGQRYLANAPELLALKERCLVHRRFFKKYFRLDFHKDQASASFFTRLAKRLGHEIYVNKPGTGKDRVYCYGVHTMDSVSDRLEESSQELGQLRELWEELSCSLPPGSDRLERLRGGLEVLAVQVARWERLKSKLTVRLELLDAARLKLAAEGCLNSSSMQFVALVEEKQNRSGHGPPEGETG